MSEAQSVSPPLAGPWLWSRGALSWPRLLIAISAALAAAAALIMLDDGTVSFFAWTEVALLGVATLLMPLDRVDAHVFIRAVLWGVLSFGAGATLADGRAPETTVLCASAIALLALGRAGLTGTHGAFAPRVLRRSLLAMMVTGLCVAHVFVVGAAMLPLEVSYFGWMPPSHFFTRVAMIASPALLLVGVAGLARTRSWGLFAYLGAIASAGLVVALAWVNGYPGYLHTPFVLGGAFGVGGVLLLLVSLPVASALVFRRAPSDAGHAWGEYLHAALVVVIVLGCFLASHTGA